MEPDQAPSPATVERHKTEPLTRRTLRCAVRKGSALRSDRWRGSLRSALTDGSAAGVFHL
jgi:hypothetical protein